MRQATPRTHSNRSMRQAGINLEEIAQRKAAVRQQIASQKAVVGKLASELFAPIKPAATKAEGVMRLFNTSFAVFDGLLMGIKIMRKVQRLIRRFA